mmetsp:Transcript_35993/g.110767  ORF Transcript_35993/g.110767 Transcript_35993/m.110767 type:complete len:322 (-) Transcript_35993:14-979(-)
MLPEEVLIDAPELLEYRLKYGHVLLQRVAHRAQVNAEGHEASLQLPQQVIALLLSQLEDHGELREEVRDRDAVGPSSCAEEVNAERLVYCQRELGDHVDTSCLADKGHKALGFDQLGDTTLLDCSQLGRCGYGALPAELLALEHVPCILGPLAKHGTALGEDLRYVAGRGVDAAGRPRHLRTACWPALLHGLGLLPDALAVLRARHQAHALPRGIPHGIVDSQGVLLGRSIPQELRHGVHVLQLPVPDVRALPGLRGPEGGKELACAIPGRLVPELLREAQELQDGRQELLLAAGLHSLQLLISEPVHRRPRACAHARPSL